MAALLTGAALLAARTTQQALDISRTMETQTNWGHRVVAVRIGGPTWTLWSFDFTLEEACGNTCVLAHLMLYCFFESWGLSGPRPLRWLAIVFHALLAAVFALGAQTFLAPRVRGGSDAEPGEAAGVVWLCIAVGAWATTSWAAVTWWRLAASASAPLGDECAGGCSADAHDPLQMALEELPMRMPVLALAGVQLVNFWMARRARQPVLLSACVVLAGISMAGSCYMSQDVGAAASSSLVLAPWTPAIYLSFCAMSAWVLWQELIRSL